MDAHQRELLRAMRRYPGEAAPAMTAEEFAAGLGVDDPPTWALRELTDAMQARDADALNDALGVAAIIGMDTRWSGPLADLLEADWHQHHEFVAFELARVGDARAVPALVRAAHWVPSYLEYDEARQLASKSIHSLGKIPGPEAEAALRDLLGHEDHELRRTVGRVLERREAHPPAPR